MKEGLVLFAHGSKDPQWREPFEKLAVSVGQKMPAVAVALAYLEHSASLEEALGMLVAKGALSVRIVPIFLGYGGHLRHDLPRLVEQLRPSYPALKIGVEKPIGEQPEILEAISQLIAKR